MTETSDMVHKIKVLHIFDNNPFIEPAINFLTLYQDGQIEHIFLVLYSQEKKKVNGHDIIYVKKNDTQQILELLGQRGIDALVFHGLSKYKRSFILRNKKVLQNYLLAWVIFGYDLYTLPYIKNKIFDTLTYKIYNAKNLPGKRMYNLVAGRKSIFKMLSKIPLERFPWISGHLISLSRTALRDLILARAIKQMDIISGFFDNEVKFIDVFYDHYSYLPFTYIQTGDIKDYLKDSSPKNAEKYILIGNSDAMTNNHLDILEKLKGLDLKDKKLLLPLNYSPESPYSEFIFEQAKKRFGKKARILRTYVSKSEYFTLLRQCEIAIFNHKRQQAVSNLVFLFHNGSKIFLNPSNPLYEFYQDKGLILYSTDDISDKSLQALTEEEKLHNSDTIKKLYGEERMKEFLRIFNEGLFKLAMKKKNKK